MAQVTGGGAGVAAISAAAEASALSMTQHLLPRTATWQPPLTRRMSRYIHEALHALALAGALAGIVLALHALKTSHKGL